MALTVTDNSVRQINAALLSLEKKIGETNSEKAQDKQVVQMELKNVQYNFLAPLHQSGISVSIDTTGTWEGNARSATNAEHATTVDTTDTVTSDSTTPITSGGVYTALNNLIKTKTITVGDITIPSTNRFAIDTGLTSNENLISAKLSSWSSNSGSFSIVCFGQNEIYIVAKEGTTITDVSVVAIYI